MLNLITFILFFAFKRKKKKWQTSMNVPVLGWVLVSAIVALALAWLVRKQRAARQQAPPQFAAPRPPATPQRSRAPKGEPVPAPAKSEPLPEPDDLTKISGIGPKIQQALNEEGIYTYQQLAELDVNFLQALMKRRNWYMATYTTWPEQAGQLARSKSG